MLEEAADDALDADVVGEAGNTGPQTTDAAHHHVDLNAGLARAVERIDDAVIDDRIELRPYMARPPRLDMGDFGLDVLDSSAVPG